MNTLIKIAFGAAAAALLIGGCVRPQACPAVNPYGRQTVSAVTDINVDPDLKRILGDPVAWGRVPKNTSWSPDGKRFAYSRPGDNSLVSKNRLLWIFETLGMRERPLLPDPQPAVQEFEWLNPDTLVLLSDGKFLKVTTSGEVTGLGPFDEKERGSIAHMRLSGDGLRVAFVRNCALEIMTLSDGVVQRVASGEARQCPGVVPEGYSAAFRTPEGLGWSADGRNLWFYQAQNDPVLSARVRIARIDSSPLKISTLSTPDNDGYIPWIGFHPDGKRLAIVQMDRLQTHLSLEFCGLDGSNCEVVLTESDPRWVNYLGPPRFFGPRNDYMWISERAGMAHIYLYGGRGELPVTVTEGDWAVFDINRVSADGQEIVFTADIHAPWTRSVYRLNRSAGDLLPLSTEEGTHMVSFSPDGAFWLDTHSTVDHPAVTDLMERGGEVKSAVDMAMRRAYSTSDVLNRLETIEIDDETSLIAHWTRPEVISPNQKYPVIVVMDEIAGDLTTTDAFHGVFSAWRNHLARMGIMVVSVDGSGKRGQGKVLESRIHRNPVGVVLDDQLRALEVIVDAPGVDSERIGIIGRGLGATVALRMILNARRDPAFRFGIVVDPLPGLEYASAPVIERYWQRPQDNPEGYAAADILPLLKELRMPLFIACGSEEGQPMFAATQDVVNGFVKAGKMVDVACYARPINAVMDESTRVHLYSRITRFIAEHI